MDYPICEHVKTSDAEVTSITGAHGYSVDKPSVASSQHHCSFPACGALWYLDYEFTPRMNSHVIIVLKAKRRFSEVKEHEKALGSASWAANTRVRQSKGKESRPRLAGSTYSVMRMIIPPQLQKRRGKPSSWRAGGRKGCGMESGWLENAKVCGCSNSRRQT